MTTPDPNSDTLPPLPERGAVPFALDGDQFELPELPTPVWLDAMGYAMPGAWARLLPEHLPAGQQAAILRRLNDPRDSFDIDHLEKAALRVLAAPLGVEFHAAQRLIVAVRSQWMLFDARCASYGIDPVVTHISRLVNIAFQLRMEACEKESERLSAKAQIFAPPDGTRASGRPWSDDPDAQATLDKIESDAFMAMFG